METSYAARDHGVALPPIHIDDGSPSRGFGSLSRSSYSPPFSSALSSSIPMSIPQTASHVHGLSHHHEPSHLHAPPPLPPPQYIPVSGPDSADATRYRRAFDAVEELPHYKTRPDRADEGYHSLESPLSRGGGGGGGGGETFGSGRFGVHHSQFQFKPSTDAYDHSMLKKLDSRRVRENRSPPRRSGLSASARDAHHHHHHHHHSSRASDRSASALPTLSLPTRFKAQPPTSAASSSSMLDSPSRYTETPLHSAVSPRSAPFGSNSRGSEYRQHRHQHHESTDLEQSPMARSRRTNSGSQPDDSMTQGSSYDMMMTGGDDVDFPMVEETSRLRDFHIDGALAARPSDYPTTTAGMKRRASSPPNDEPSLHSVPSSSDLLRRREAVSRGSPTPRLTVIPQGSISSVSSAGRSNSYASTLSLTASSMTSVNSFRRSPGGLSPGGMSPTEPSALCGSPYATPMPLTTSPRSSLSQLPPHHRSLSGQPTRVLMSPRKLTEIPKSSASKIQDFFMCDCCPKKPKKFDTAEELSVHESEKQYECSFCGNRFKNKNEAERHQNSLHVRRHSWSCSVLLGYDRAFHESTSRPGEADTCGYCGEEFPRTGHGGLSMSKHVTPQDWDERARHLQDVHKFRECNSSKKFYRADHFRQHLKHSHAGTSGKWTNMLENACMLEEEPPLPIR